MVKLKLEAKKAIAEITGEQNNISEEISKITSKSFFFSCIWIHELFLIVYLITYTHAHTYTSKCIVTIPLISPEKMSEPPYR